MEKKPLVERKYLFTFILITSLFALWGFANDITNPMVAAFQTLMELSAAKASMVQFAFYGGYATMAIPAALFIRKYSYKKGILLGLALYAIGAFLFIPAAAWQEFTFFCLSLYILTFGLAFLETTANPFILSLGDKSTSTRRLNLAQAFNPMGSLCGMSVASLIVLPQLISDRRDEAGKIIFPMLSEAEKADIRVHDLAIIRDPYVAIGLVVLCVFIIIALTKMPKTQGEEQKEAGLGHSVGQTLSNLWHNTIYREGVVSQMFYVAAQIMTWTFIIQYADFYRGQRPVADQFPGFFQPDRVSAPVFFPFPIPGIPFLVIGFVCFVGKNIIWKRNLKQGCFGSYIRRKFPQVFQCFHTLKTDLIHSSTMYRVQVILISKNLYGAGNIPALIMPK